MKTYIIGLLGHGKGHICLKGEIRFNLFGKDFISCLNRANVCAFQEILTVYSLNLHF